MTAEHKPTSVPKDAVELQDEARLAHERGVKLPTWRWLARRNAFNRSIFLSRLALDLGRIERATPKLTECPVCKEWAEKHDACLA